MSNTSARVSIRKPITRYVYLVEDASDAGRMGGLPENTYNNAQLAWDAAVAIITANPTYNVVIRVGVTTAAGVGGITMSTLDCFAKISLVGLSSKLSVIGDFTITNGAVTNSDRGWIKNMTVGNFNNTAGGNLFLTIQDSNVGNLTASVGNLIYIYNSYDSRIGDVTLSTAIVTSTAGLQFINCGGLYINSVTATVNATVIVNTIVGAPGLQSGNDHPTITFGTVSMTGLLRPVGSEFRNCEFLGNFTFTNSSNGGGSTFPLTFENCKFQGAVALTANSAIVTNIASTTIKDCHFVSPSATLTFSGLRMLPTISFSRIFSIINLSANSVLMNNTFYSTSIATPLINGIGTGCSIYNCSFVGGSFAIDNGSQVKVTSYNTFYTNRVGTNVWIVPEDMITSTITTTNAAVNNNAQSINIPSNSVVMITTRVEARNTATGVGNGYVLMAKARNIAGVVTLGTISNTYTQEDTPAWDATFTVVGTTVRVTVQGSGGTTVDWAITSKINS